MSLLTLAYRTKEWGSASIFKSQDPGGLLYSLAIISRQLVACSCACKNRCLVLSTVLLQPSVSIVIWVHPAFIISPRETVQYWVKLSSKPTSIYLKQPDFQCACTGYPLCQQTRFTVWVLPLPSDTQLAFHSFFIRLLLPSWSVHFSVWRWAAWEGWSATVNTLLCYMGEHLSWQN